MVAGKTIGIEMRACGPALQLSVSVSVSVSVPVSARVGHPPQHGPHLVQQRQHLLSGGAGHRPGPGQKLQVHRKLPGRGVGHLPVIDAVTARAPLALATTVKGPYRPLTEQVITAAASVPANLVEGQGRSGRDCIYHWQVAYASARELSVHLEVLAGAGAVPHPAAQQVLALLDKVRAMLWRMTHPR